MSRINKSIKNTMFGLCGMMIVMLLSFVSRSIFIRYLGQEFNGLNSLFTNVLSLLNLAELGFASAVAFALYKPLANNDSKSISMIIGYLKRVYMIVAVVVSVAGIICMPFLEYLIAEPLDTLPFSLLQLKCYFGMYLLNTVMSYLLAYKRTIITADQNQYVISNTDNLANIILNIFQIVFLLITKNYFIFLGSMIAKTLFTNIFLSLYANKKYDFLAIKPEKITNELKAPIVKNIKALVFHKLGSVIIFGSISIVISTFIGLTQTGIYGNYSLITAGVLSVIGVIFTSFTASIGDYCTSASVDSQKSMLSKIDFIGNYFAYFTFICFTTLFNPFINLWIGDNSTFGIPVVIMIALYQMVTYIRRPVGTFKDAKGLYRQDMFKPVLEAVVGVGLAIGLSYVLGIFGIILGYTLATLFISMPIEIYVLYKHGFEGKSCVPLLIKKLAVIIFSFIVCACVYFVCSLVPFDGVLRFVLQLLICLILPNTIFILATFWTDEFKYFKNLGFGMLSKIFKKRKPLSVDNKIGEVEESINCDNDSGGIQSESTD